MKGEWIEPRERKWINGKKELLRVRDLIEVLSRFPNPDMEVDFYVEDVGSPYLEEIDEWEGYLRISLI